MIYKKVDHDPFILNRNPVKVRKTKKTRTDEPENTSTSKGTHRHRHLCGRTELIERYYYSSVYLGRFNQLDLVILNLNELQQFNRI
jgi:hypothetical protein